MFFDQMVNGIAVGSIYALIALGYTMVYGIVKLINFAHGDLLMLGAFAGFFMLVNAQPSTPGSMIISILIAMVVCAVVGVIIEFTCYRPLRNAPRINALITAIGVSLLIENGSRVIPFIGPNFKQYPSIEGINQKFFGISVKQLTVFLVSVVLMYALNRIVTKTKVGKAMRAVSYDNVAASFMGINVNKIISFTFAVGAALAGAAGVLYAISYPMIEPYMGIMPGLKAFVAAVLGGIGSIPGAMLGGFIMGIAETLTKGYISSQLSDAVSFGILIVILLIRPTGIIGEKTSEKV